MSTLYPLKFNPIFKEKIWGGDKIKTILKKDFSPLANCGELWALSGLEGEESVVENGFLSGNDLNELIEIYMDELVGDSIYQKFGNEFPVLIKFLNSKDFLSVQVHPDDKQAMINHNSMGKTEMWYIIDCDEDSELVIGLKEGIDKERYIQNLNDGHIEDVLNYVKIAKEDVFYIPAGRVHAIGKGVLLAEIQQTSDLTYRIYDWDRVDDKGNKRELHTDMALDAINFHTESNYYTHYARINNIPTEILQTPYFNVNNLIVDEKQTVDLLLRDSFTVYVCIEGAFKVIQDDTEVLVSLGECVLIPAEIDEITIIPLGKALLLEVFL